MNPPSSMTIAQSQAELIELAYVAMIVRDLDSRILFWNQRAEQVYGWSKAEALGQVTHSLLKTRWPISLKATDEMLQRTGHWEGKLIHTTRFGTEITVLSRQAIQLDRHGKPAAILEVNLDITGQEQARHALEESEQRFRTSIENMLDAFAILSARRNESGRIVDFIYDFVNEAASRATTLPRDAMIGHGLLATRTNVRSVGLFDQYVAVVETGEPLIIESLEYEDDFGGHVERRAFALQAVKLGDGFAVVWRDITARKRQEEEVRGLNAQVRHQAELLDEVLSASPDHFYMYDRKGRIIYVNASAAQALGLERTGLVGKTWSELAFPADLMEPFDEQRAQVFDTGQPVTGEMKFPVPGGPRDYEYVLSPIHGADGRVESVVATVRDISLRKAAEEQVRQLNRELEARVYERTSQLEAANGELEAFSYSVSHDLRTPLRAIDGFSRILLEDYAPQLDPDATEFLTLVRQNTQQMSQLIDDLLSFSRLGRQEMRLQTVNAGEVAQAAWQNVLPLVEGRRVDLTIEEDMPACLADPTLLRQVFTNLLGNALKYTRPRAHAVIEVGAQHQDGEVMFYVRDNGIGFDMQYAHKLFGVFQRLQRAEEYEGTGVGLAIVQRIVHRHGGRVWAKGAINEGATFYFTLGDSHDA